MKKRNGWLLLAAVSILTYASGCRRIAVEPTADGGYSLETAKLITHATAGVVSSHDAIRVRFSRPMIPVSRIGAAIEERLFSFSPGLNGKTEWEDPQTLRFTPADALPLATDFAAVLQVERAAGEKCEPFPFRFRTAARELASFDGRFVQSDDPSILSYSARVSFTEALPLRLVERGFSATLRDEGARRGRRLPIHWQSTEGEREFLLTVAEIERGAGRRILEVSAESGILGLSASLRREIPLESHTGFGVTNVVTHREGKNPEIAVRFSDELARNQDLTGLLRIEPYVDVRLNTVGDTVYVTGDLAFGETYRLVANGGIRSSRGTETEEAREFDVEEDVSPQVSFLQGGVFLTSSGDRRIYFKTVNLRRVRVEVKRVFENNLGQFLQTERLSSAGDRSEPFHSEYVYRVGVTAADESLTIGERRNVWLNHELDLRELIGEGDRGLYLIGLSFERDDMIWRFDDEETYYWGDDYYSNPNSYGYIWAHGRVYKPLISSDIGLTWKAGGNRSVVFATNLIDSEPEGGVDVALMSYQNQLIARGTTDRYGRVEFPGAWQGAFYVTGEKGGQRSVIKANEMGWDLSSFDTQGEDIPPDGTRGFLYTERGVYRPGDAIHLSAIFRNRDGGFPDAHPVTLKFINPLDQLVYEEVNTEGEAGFYGFTLNTAATDPTGNWRAEVQAGSRKFTRTIRVETIVPFRLKVNIASDRQIIPHGDFTFGGRLESTYLFGAPAAGLEAVVEASLESREQRFTGYPGFRFTDESREYEPYGEIVFDGLLDSEGAAPLYWDLPRFAGAPSALSLVLTARVFEPGGRASRKVLTVPVEAYPAYVGLKRPEMRWGYAQIGQRLLVPAIVVDAGGEVLPGRELTYRVYRNNTYWWWEYDSYADYQLRYKSDTETELIGEGSIFSRTVPSSIELVPDGWGEYLVEVEDEEGHNAGFFFRASAWAGQAAMGEEGGLLSLAADKEVYHPGEEAVISFPSVEDGRLLVTVEKAMDILSADWHPLEREETRVRIPVTADMVPNAYVSVSLIQPHAQTANDRPIRMYGVIPIAVEVPETRQHLELTVPEQIAPNETFQVTLQTADRRPTRFTLSVVDEGLLDITAFTTPDPWKAFFSKQRLGVASYDLFSQVVGVHRGDLFRVFAVGGGDEDFMAESPEMGEKKRFPAVVLHRGPMTTDLRGRATLSFTMPNYMGSVRVMAVSAAGESYGTADATVPVRSDLVLLPTLPRVLGPDEEIRIPVTLFSLSEDSGSVSVSLESEGPVAAIGGSRKSVDLRGKAEAETAFELRSLAEVGDATITITAKSRTAEVRSVTHLEVRASSAPLYRIEKKTGEPGSRVLLRIPDDGIPGTNAARVSITRRGDLDLDRRLGWLVRYPYGCIEQTTSAVFPQLYLKRIMEMEPREEARIDDNINAGLDRLRKFQLPSGGFSFWPGGTGISHWGTNYAGHFLLEAERLGYAVGREMMDRWLLFQSGRALSAADDLTNRVYRVYLLSLAGKAAFGPMNLLRENHLYEMTDHERWLLAAAYSLAGVEETADNILAGTGVSVEPYSEFAGTYGSGLRDRAMILDMAVQLSRWDTADTLYDQLAERLGSADWYSTQTLGYSLLAAGKYLASQEGPERPLMKGKIILPEGAVVPFSTGEFAFKQEITEGFGRFLIVSIDSGTTLPRLHVALEWEGVPLIATEEEDAENIALSVSWYDEDGRSIDGESIVQGSTFWGRLQVRKTVPYRLSLEEMALTQIVPSGWEIENIRLTGEGYPPWMGGYRFGSVEHIDIRDDRISWFFDMPSHIQVLDFAVKLQAVTEGRFSLPSAICEAMYRHDFRALFPGGEVVVEGRR